MKTYSVIYADPPWRYSFSKSKSREIENQYPTMTVEDICKMKIPSADNAVLYMWATSPKLEEAFKVMCAWGFQYKTHAIWDKEILGMGYWFRGQHELLMVGVKGHFSPPKASTRIGSVIKERRSKHSRKPSKVRNYISSWYPNENRLELFARTATKGWDVFGNEVKSDINIDADSDVPPREPHKAFENF